MEQASKLVSSTQNLSLNEIRNLFLTFYQLRNANSNSAETYSNSIDFPFWYDVLHKHFETWTSPFQRYVFTDVDWRHCQHFKGSEYTRSSQANTVWDVVLYYNQWACAFAVRVQEVLWYAVAMFIFTLYPFIYMCRNFSSFCWLYKVKKKL
jgi:hypothetical protein